MSADVAANLAGVFGTSRCGSTWLGSIIAAHPGVAYRFEPFHRRKREAEFLDLRRRIEEGDLGDDLAETLYAKLLASHPLTEKPPFFRKEYDVRWRRGQGALWPAARKSRAAAALFRWLYTPRGAPMIVFKEVNLERLMIRLVREAHVPVVYLVRHPAAVTWSHLKGQERKVMSDTRERDMTRRLEEAGAGLSDRFADRLDDLSKVQKRALLWRMSVDQAWDALEDAGNFRLLFYEDLCRDPDGRSREVFKFLGLDFPEQVSRFVTASTTPSETSRWKRGEFFTSKYFSVFRDPAESMNYWRKEMPEDAQREALEIVEDSPVYRLGVERGTWD